MNTEQLIKEKARLKAILAHLKSEFDASKRPENQNRRTLSEQRSIKRR